MPAKDVEPWLGAFARVVRAPSRDDVRAAARENDVTALVADGRGVTDELFTAADDDAYLRVAVDDGPPRPLALDVLIEPNLCADGAGYTLPESAKVLAGSRYALVPAAVREARERVRPLAPVGRRVIVTCGGADPARMTERYLEVLAAAGQQFDVRVIVGPLNREREVLRAAAAARGYAFDVDATDLIAHALWCDLALTTLGGTAAELACLGVPNLATAVSDTQIPHLERYGAAGVVLPLGHVDTFDLTGAVDTLRPFAHDLEARRRMRAAARANVDGLGAPRVADALLAWLARKR